jgi:flavin-dependent dehydrogenase
MELYFFAGGYGGVGPIEGQRFNVCLLVTRDAFLRSGGTVRGMLDMATHLNPAFGHRLMGSRPLPETEVAVAPVDTQRPGVPWDTTACIGDAAVMMPPLCGDGQAMALRSAELYAPLLDALLHGRRSLADVRAGYTAAWHREFDGPLRTGRRLQALLNMPGLSDGLISVGHLVPALATRLVHATRGQPRPLATVTPLAGAPAMNETDESGVRAMGRVGGDSSTPAHPGARWH